MYRFETYMESIHKALNEFFKPSYAIAFAGTQQTSSKDLKAKNAYFFQREFNQLASSFFQVDTQQVEEKQEVQKGGKKFRTFARLLVFPVFLILLIALEIASRLKMIDEEENNKSKINNSSENTYIKIDDSI